MYAFLIEILPPRLAEILSAVVYGTMIMLTVYFAFEPQAEFSYLNF